MDNSTIFSNVARIPDSMLKLVDPKNQLLVQYLVSIDSSHLIGVLPQKGVEGTFKALKATKKKKQFEKKKVVEEEIVKETIPMKTWVLKRMKKPAKTPSESLIKKTTQEPIVESVEPWMSNLQSLFLLRVV